MKTSCRCNQIVFLVLFLTAGGVLGQGIRPTEGDVSYGQHERHVLDFWKAESDKPTPLLISIHGGGFRGGRKGVEANLLKRCLDNGISVAAITYRLSGEAKAPAAFEDAAQAVQFLRSKAKDWNLDAERFAATGGSAGAGLSLWLAFHDDLADPRSDDPLKRYSTRLKCAFVFNGQTTYDPRAIRKLFPEYDVHKHSALEQLFDAKLNDLADLPEAKTKIMEEISPLTHLGKGDPPVLLTYRASLDTKVTSLSIGIHHPRFGKLLQGKMEELGIPCLLETGAERKTSARALKFLQQYLIGSDEGDKETHHEKK